MPYFNLPFSVRISNENPVDGDRYLVTDDTARDALVTDGRAYQGLLIYHQADAKLYMLETYDPNPIYCVWSELIFTGSDHDKLGGLLDDDHTQYVPVNASRGFTAPVSGISPVLGVHLSTKTYVDNLNTALYGAFLSALTGYVKTDGTQYFTASVSGIDPTDDAHLATKSYVDNKVIEDHGLLSGLGDDDHTQYLRTDGSRASTGQQTFNAGIKLDDIAPLVEGNANRVTMSGLFIIQDRDSDDSRPLEVSYSSRASGAAGFFLHSYRDKTDHTPDYHPVRIDCVGSGNSSIVYLANAVNTNYRPDVWYPDFDYLHCYEATADPTATVSGNDIFYITKDAQLKWSGARRVGSGTTDGGVDGGTTAGIAEFMWDGNPQHQAATDYAFNFKTAYGVGTGDATTLKRFLRFQAASSDLWSMYSDTPGDLLYWDFGATWSTGIQMKLINGSLTTLINNTAHRYYIQYSGQKSQYHHHWSQTGTPVGVDEGETWWNTTTDKFYIYDGSSWTQFNPSMMDGMDAYALLDSSPAFTGDLSANSITTSGLNILSTSGVITLFNSQTNPAHVGALDFLEVDPDWDSGSAYGFRLKLNGVDNYLELWTVSLSTYLRAMYMERNTGATTFVSTVAGANATAATHFMNRQTADGRYYQKTEFVTSSAADSPVLTDGSGFIDDSFINQTAVTQHNDALDHGSLVGLDDNDHPQYFYKDGSQDFEGPLTVLGSGIFSSGIVAGTTSQLAGIDLTGDVNASEYNIYFTEYDNGTEASAIDLKWDLRGPKHKLTLGGAAVAVTFSDPPGACNILLKIVQDGTGGRTIDWSGVSTLKWPGGTEPTLSTGAGAVDIITFYFDGTNYYGMAGLNFS